MFKAWPGEVSNSGVYSICSWVFDAPDKLAVLVYGMLFTVLYKFSTTWGKGKGMSTVGFEPVA
jgi:hypothetical protein